MNYYDAIVAWFGVLGVVGILIVVGLLIVMILLNLLFLKIGIKAVKGSNLKGGALFGTWLLGILCNLVPCVGCILYWVVINNRHKTGFGNAIIAWLIAILLPGLIVVGIFFLISLTGLIVLPAF